MLNRTKEDIIRLITIIGFTLQDDYISMNNTHVQTYEMGKLVIRFHNGEVTLNNKDENFYIFYIIKNENYNKAYYAITEYFKIEFRKGKIKLLDE